MNPNLNTILALKTIFTYMHTVLEPEFWCVLLSANFPLCLNHDVCCLVISVAAYCWLMHCSSEGQVVAAHISEGKSSWVALSEMERKQEALGSLSEPNVAPGNSRYARLQSCAWRWKWHWAPCLYMRRLSLRTKRIEAEWEEDNRATKNKTTFNLFDVHVMDIMLNLHI